MDHGLNGETILKRMFRRSVLYSFSGFFTVMLNTAVDGMMIGHFLGLKAMAAFGLIVPLYSLINLVPVLLRSASQLNVGEDLGRGKLKAARQRIFQLLMTGLAASIPFMLLFTVLRGAAVSMLCSFSAHAEDTTEMAEKYLLWLAPSMLPIMTTPVLHPVMQLDGDVRRSPFAIHVATVVNILGDILNVTVFHGGMAGMAAATVLSCYTELLVLLLHYRSKTSLLRPLPSFRLQMEWAKALSKGIPVMLHELTTFFAVIAINHLSFQLAGEELVAAAAAGNSVFAFLLPGSLAVSGAVMTLGSIAYGETDHRGLKSIFTMGLWYALVPCSLYALAVILTAAPFAWLYTGEDEHLLAMTAAIIRGYAVSLPFVAVCQVIESYFNVIEKRRLATVISMLEGGIAWVVFVWILSGMEPVSRIWAGHLFGIVSIILVIAGCFVVRRMITHRIELQNRTERQSQIESQNRKELFTGKVYDPAALETTVRNTNEATDFSESVRRFCIDNGISSRLSMLAALCVEEVACNTLLWGYSGESDCAVDIRTVCSDKEITLRFRDYGRHFDPENYISHVLVNDKDPARNIGLRIISGITSDMQYMCIVDCNVFLIHLGRQESYAEVV